MIVNKQTPKKEEKVRVEGKVIGVLPNTRYKIEINIGGFKHTLNGYISGRMRQHYIKITDGDGVVVEISPLNLDIGRIVYKKDANKPVPSYIMETNSDDEAIAA